MKIGTIVLLVQYRNDIPSLVETLSDDQEISILESSLNDGHSNPLRFVYQHRKDKSREDEEFGDFIEELLSKPFLRPEIQQHALQWLKSKMRIEQYQKSEIQAASVIADYAYKIFAQDPSHTDFYLAGPTAQVRVRVFVIEEGCKAHIA